jgi:hypothetical protein
MRITERAGLQKGQRIGVYVCHCGTNIAAGVDVEEVAGYAAGLDAQRSRLPIYTIGVLVAIVIFLIQDIDRPGPGLITVSQQPMIDTAAFIAAFPD